MSGRRGAWGDVTFNQLRTFRSVALAGSFAKAAEQLDVSQPTVSEIIRAFEGRLARPLFHRRNGFAASLTPSGEEVLENVNKILDLYGEILKDDRQSVAKTLVKISLGTHLVERCMRPLLPTIYNAHPNVEIEFFPMLAWAQVAPSVESGAIDLAVFAVTQDLEPPPQASLICDVQMVMVAPLGARARLASGDCTLEDLQYIFPIRRSLGERFVAQTLGVLGITVRRPPLYVEYVDVLLNMVERGEGVGAIQAYLAADLVADGRVEVLDIPLRPMRRMMLRSPRAAPIAQEIEAILKDALVT